MTSSKEPIDLADLLHQAQECLHQNDLPGAIQTCLEVIDIAKTHNDATNQVLALILLAQAYAETGELPKEETSLEEALNLSTINNLAGLETQCCLLLGHLAYSSGKGAQAVDLFIRALTTALSLGNLADAALAFSNLGLSYLGLGSLEQAIECFNQAIETDPQNENLAAWLCARAQGLCQLNQKEKAKEQYQRALLEAKLHNNIEVIGLCLSGLGELAYEEEDYDVAITFFEQALEYSLENDTSVGFLNLAEVYLKCNKLQQAKELLAKALSLINDDKAHLAQVYKAAIYDGLAQCAVLQNEVPDEHWQEAINLSEMCQDRTGLQCYLSGFAEYLKNQGELERAYQYFVQAIGLFENQRSTLKSDLLRTSFATGGNELYEHVVELCLKRSQPGKALEFMERAKSRALLDLMSNNPIDLIELERYEDPQTQALINKEILLREQVVGQEQSLWYAGQQKEDSKEVFNQWLETLEQLKRRHPQYASLISVQSITFNDLKKLWISETTVAPILKPGQAIIEFFRAPNYLAISLIHAESVAPHIVLVDDKSASEKLIDDLVSFIELSSQATMDVPRSLSQRLYNVLLRDVLAELPREIDHLIFVPHGLLHRLPFAALHDGSSYLVERYAISYVPSASVIPLIAVRDKQPVDSQELLNMLVLAVSNYASSRSSLGVSAEEGLPDLPFAQQECLEIAGTMNKRGSNLTMVENEQVRLQLTNLFRGHDIIHYAGHAYFDPVEPLASGLIFEDGSILSAALILQNLRLKSDRVRLFSISACQTGLPAISSADELIGLSRALLFAGSKNLLLTLYEVGDQSTAKLMTHFYECLNLKRFNCAESLAVSQRQSIKAGSFVNKFAALVHIGIE